MSEERKESFWKSRKRGITKKNLTPTWMLPQDYFEF